MSLVNQNSRGPTKHKSNHYFSTGNENVYSRLLDRFQKRIGDVFII